MKRLMATGFVLLTALSGALAGGKSDGKAPIVSGTTKGNVGCVILEKHMPVKGKLLLAGVVYARTEYRVIETFNYKIDKQKFTGRGEINQLNQMAVKDRVKLVVIPAKHTADQLDQAKKLCKE